MNYKLIMLPNPILVSNEQLIKGDKCFDPTTDNGVYSSVLRTDTNSYWNKNKFPKIVAGIEGLPKLNLSAIAEEIGWVDVEKLAISAFQKKFGRTPIIMGSAEADSSWLNTWIDGFKAAQSLNEKKFSEEDARQLIKRAILYAARFAEDAINHEEDILRSIKPKEYNVEVEMEMFNTRQSTDYTPYEKGSLIPIIKITNNTITVTKIIKQL